MAIIKKEPAMVAGAVTAVVGLALVYGVVDEAQAAAWTGLLLVISPLLQGLATRFLVFSPNTLEEAGLDPKEVQDNADDPDVKPKRKRASK